MKYVDESASSDVPSCPSPFGTTYATLVGQLKGVTKYSTVEKVVKSWTETIPMIDMVTQNLYTVQMDTDTIGPIASNHLANAMKQGIPLPKEDMTPIHTSPDGGCFMHVLSRLCRGYLPFFF